MRQKVLFKRGKCFLQATSISSARGNDFQVNPDRPVCEQLHPNLTGILEETNGYEGSFEVDQGFS